METEQQSISTLALDKMPCLGSWCKSQFWLILIPSKSQQNLIIENLVQMTINRTWFEMWFQTDFFAVVCLIPEALVRSNRISECLALLQTRQSQSDRSAGFHVALAGGPITQDDWFIAASYSCCFFVLPDMSYTTVVHTHRKVQGKQILLLEYKKSLPAGNQHLLPLNNVDHLVIKKIFHEHYRCQLRGNFPFKTYAATLKTCAIATATLLDRRVMSWPVNPIRSLIKAPEFV